MRRESTRQTLMLLKVLVKAKAEHGSSLAQTCGDFIALHLSSVGSSSRVLANTADAPSGSAELTPCSCAACTSLLSTPHIPSFSYQPSYHSLQTRRAEENWLYHKIIQLIHSWVHRIIIIILFTFLYWELLLFISPFLSNLTYDREWL